MTAKEYLRQARHLEGLVTAKREQLAMLRDLSENIRSNKLSKLPKSKSQGDLISATVARLVDLECLIEQNIVDLAQLKGEIILRIGTIQEFELRRVLELRYLNCKKWEQIAAEMHYSYKGVHLLHAKALARFEQASG